MTSRHATVPLSLTLAALMPLAALASGPEVDPGTNKRGGPPPRIAAAPLPLTAPGAPSAAQRAVVDPRTGRLVKEPPASGVVLSPQMREALSDSSEGLVEVPWGRGGFRVDLEGRFQSAVIAVVDDGGAVKVDCVSHVPPAPASSDKPVEAAHAK